MKNLIITLVLCVPFLGMSQQEDQEYFASFVVDSIPTIQDYREIDNQMRLIEGVLVSRMDIPTNRYYIRFTASEMYDEMWFRSKFLELGNYSIHCIQLGEKDVDALIPITKDTCTEL